MHEPLHAGQGHFTMYQIVEKFWEQIVVVVPIVAYLIFFKVIVLGMPLNMDSEVVLGMCSVLAGLVLFMDGLRYGIMPLGESIGVLLPRHLRQTTILMVAWVLGVGVTFAEPAIGALQTLGTLVHCDKAPYLYVLLNEWTLSLVMSIGAGVGIAAMIGMLRLLNSWSIKPVIYLSVGITLGLSLFVWFSGVAEILGLAWDCGAVTTGPVTVPVVIALGIGLASTSGKEDPLSGFGIVTLASLYPINTVLLLGLYLETIFTPEQIIEQTCSKLAEVEVTLDTALESADPDAAWFERSPYNEIVLGVRAVVPLIGFLMSLSKYIERQEAARNNAVDGVDLGLLRSGDKSGYTKVKLQETPPDRGVAVPQDQDANGMVQMQLDPSVALDPELDQMELGRSESAVVQPVPGLQRLTPRRGSRDDTELEVIATTETHEKKKRARRFSLPTDLRNTLNKPRSPVQMPLKTEQSLNEQLYGGGRVLKQLRQHNRQRRDDDTEGTSAMEDIDLGHSWMPGSDDEVEEVEVGVGSEMRAPHVQGWSMYGLGALLFGLLLFNEGLTYGLNRMGSETGMIIPAAFVENKFVPNSPLFSYPVGVSITVLFAFVLGVGATLAEPALRVLGEKVEELTDGQMRASLVVRSVAVGVSIGVSLGVLKIIFSIHIMYFLVPLYPLACVMTYFSREEVVNVAWDCAGVTTSEVTVPIVLSLGLGVGNALQASEGFGILSLASIGPIISVLASGLLSEALQCLRGGYEVVDPGAVDL